MRKLQGLALAVLIWPVVASAQTLMPGLPGAPLQSNLQPLYRPQRLPVDTTPAKPGADLAYGAYQRGYHITALQEAMKRLDANKNDAAAMTLIGEIYKDGFGVRTDPSESARWYKLAADRGDPQAAFLLGMAALEGKGVPKDRDNARKLFEKAAAAEHAGAIYNLGIMAIDADIQDFRGAAALFRRAAEAGNMDGAYSLAVLYREGKGVPKDMSSAATWMKRAADEHIAAAEIEYGIMLFNGEGVVRNEADAARYFLRSAVRNNPVAMNRIARLYASGRGVEKNMVQAIKWHVLARAVGIKDEWLDSLMSGLNARETSEVEQAVRQFVGR